MKSSYSYANDLRHTIQVEHSIHLSDEANSAILRTIQDAQYTANKATLEDMAYWRQLYHDAEIKLKEARHELEQRTSEGNIETTAKAY